MPCANGLSTWKPLFRSFNRNNHWLALGGVHEADNQHQQRNGNTSSHIGNANRVDVEPGSKVNCFLANKVTWNVDKTTQKSPTHGYKWHKGVLCREISVDVDGNLRIPGACLDVWFDNANERKLIFFFVLHYTSLEARKRRDISQNPWCARVLFRKTGSVRINRE